MSEAKRKKILVTGGGKGVGAAILRALAAQGFDLDFTVRSSIAPAEALIAELKSTYKDINISVLPLDLANVAAVEAFAEQCEAQDYYGLVHNAGQSYDALALMMNQEKAQETMQVNYWSLTRLAKSVVRNMVRARAGRIILIGSVTALQANPGNAAYAASKAALLGYARSLAIETAKRGICVNYIAPGFIDTDMMSGYAAYHEKMAGQIPAGRFAKPEEIAALVAFLASPAAGYITGAVLPIDGGLTAQIGVHR